MVMSTCVLMRLTAIFKASALAERSTEQCNPVRPSAWTTMYALVVGTFEGIMVVYSSKLKGGC